MKTNYDLKKEWPRIKEELNRLSKEALVLAKKGEKEVRRFSQKGKMHLDATALRLKQEHLYRAIGKEYIKAKCPAKPTPALEKLVDEWNQIDKEARALNKKIKAAGKADGPASR